ncbi:hypothetical protein FGG08_007404 [Glutinoglossum americanum]|uniref:Reticulon-like protein n=1 Tax=Glutinoglossum americanum TaxID=1670608 RepID=A0A9P8I3E5_9PEZI|nr:hypothetical protein FGG08_007404 [Glutinoglossum americanum]
MTDIDLAPSTSEHNSDVMYPAIENNAILNGHAPTVQNTKDAVGDSKILTHVLLVNIKTPLVQQGHGWSLLTPYLGPVAENVKVGYANTQADLRGLANSRTAPAQPATTGQPLTATATAELVGRLTISHGLASQFRPRRYYTIPRETVDSIFDELHELLNFFVLEFQRILYAENVLHTIAAFISSLLGYLLTKILPLWGLALIATFVTFLAPLVYISNQEIIDSQVQKVTDVISRQTAQVKDIAGQHTARATETAKAYACDLSAKAQQYVGSARGRSASPEAKQPAPKPQSYPAATTPSKPKNTASKNTSPQAPVYSESDFPTAPTEAFASSNPSHDEQKPLIAA